ncbi:MAG: dihydrodipicolinate synthase family protein [Anaerolineae bacterium]
MSGFRGVWPALVTPLNDDGRVNVAVTQELVDALIAAGIGGLYVCGSTGEGVLLSPGQRREMAEVAIGAAQGRVPVMVHVGSINTEQAVDLAQHASLAGADAISAVPPFYFDYPHQALREHYQAIAEAAGSVPLYLYYIPCYTGNEMSPEQLAALCRIPGVAGIKFSHMDMAYLSTFMALRDPEVTNVISGPDDLHLVCAVLGAEGAIGSTYNFMPRLYVDIRGALAAGELAMARRLQFSANRIIEVVRRYGAIPSVRATCQRLGFAVGSAVAPMPTLSGDELKRFHHDMDEAGLPQLLERNAVYGPEGDPMRGKLA